MCPSPHYSLSYALCVFNWWYLSWHSSWNDRQTKPQKALCLQPASSLTVALVLLILTVMPIGFENQSTDEISNIEILFTFYAHIPVYQEKGRKKLTSLRQVWGYGGHFTIGCIHMETIPLSFSLWNKLIRPHRSRFSVVANCNCTPISRISFYKPLRWLKIYMLICFWKTMRQLFLHYLFLWKLLFLIILRIFQQCLSKASFTLQILRLI